MTIRLIINSVFIATILTVASIMVAVLFAGTVELTWLEIFAVFTSYSCTYLCVKESRWNYPIGTLSTLALVALFYDKGLYASVILNAYLAPTLVYGWFRWRADYNTLPVRHVGIDMWLLAYAGFTAAFYFATLALVRHFGGVLAPADTAIMIGSILAQALLDNKRIETWLVWIPVNILAILTYWDATLPLVSFQFAVFLANAIWGYANWHRSMKASKATADLLSIVANIPLIVKVKS